MGESGFHAFFFTLDKISNNLLYDTGELIGKQRTLTCKKGVI